MIHTDCTTSQTLTVLFNGSHVEIYPMTLHDFLLYQSVDIEHIASAVNGKFIPKMLRNKTWLNAGDQIFIFQAIVGG